MYGFSETQRASPNTTPVLLLQQPRRYVWEAKILLKLAWLALGTASSRAHICENIGSSKSERLLVVLPESLLPVGLAVQNLLKPPPLVI